MKSDSCKRLMMIAFFGMLLLISVNLEALGSPPLCVFKELDATFGGSSDDWGQSIRQTIDGGYIIAGTTSSYGAGKNDIWLKKIDRSGNEIWERTFGGTRDDEVFSVVETDKGEFIVTGRTRSYGQGAYDVWLIKVDQNGNKLWDRTFGGPLDDEGYDVRQTSDGGYIVVGKTRSFGDNNNYDVWLIKTDRSGNKIWDKTFGGSQEDMGDSILQTEDGGYIIVGTTNSYGAGGFDVLFIRTDQDGNGVWDRIYGGPKSEQNPWSKGWSVLETSDGGFMLVGSTESFGAGGYDVWLVRTDANGELIAEKTYGGQFNDEGASVIKLTDNEYILAGSTSSYGEGGYDAWLIKIDRNGNKIWDQTYGGPSDDKAYSAEKTDDEGYIFVGKMRSGGLAPQSTGCCEVDKPRTSANFDLWLLKTRSGSPTIRSQPLGVVTCEGEDVAFKVEAAGTEPLKYQWKKDGTDIIGATTDYLGISGVSTDDSGSYTVMVSNSCGWIESDQAILEVISRPSISAQPTSQEISEDSVLTLSVEVSGTEPITYQWMKGDEEISGARASTFSIPSARPGDAGSYSVIVSNSCGEIKSEPAIIIVNLKPVIEVQQIYEEACEGSEISFNVEATGTEPLFYQWKRKGESITGAESKNYYIAAVSPKDGGSYSVEVSNCCGLIESNVANLTVLPKPSIQVQPASQMACEGSEVTFVVDATGTEPLSYQWKKNGENISGANAKAYIIPNIGKDDAGSYSVLVSSCCCGEAESNPAILTVNVKPSIQIQPQSQITCEGAEAYFSVEATGTEPLSYQWMKNGAEISEEVSPSLQIQGATANDAGAYSAIVSNCCGLTVSEVAHLKIEAKPSIIVQPQSQVVCEENEVSFCVQAAGSEPLDYQWAKDGAEIPGANESCFSVPKATTDSAGSYSVQVSNRCGEVMSEAAILEINTKPFILVQPRSQVACEGSGATFSVQAAGSMPLEFQWMKDGEEISGANSSSYTIAVVGIESAGNYSVLVKNGCGRAISDAAVLEINLKPSILVQPKSQAACEGTKVTFSVEASGTGSLSYQWIKDGTEIPDANSTTYSISSVSINNAGRYSVMVSSSCGQITSDAATLDINLKPRILVQPESQVACEDSIVTFSVEASGTEPLYYQWSKDGMEILEANSNAYSILNASIDDVGNYSVLVSNSCGQAGSDVATLDINTKPSIQLQPQSQVACEGSAVTFSVEASGTEPLYYQWSKDGMDIPDAASSSYTIPSVSTDSAGRYSIMASNSCGQTISNEAILEIRMKPAIMLQPVSQAVCEGSAVSFSIEATGSEPLTYQWQKDGMDIPGANANTYAIPVAGINSSGSYNAVVSNDCGQAKSDQAILTIDMRPSILVQPLSQEVCEGSEVTFGVEAEGTGPLSYQWMKDGMEISGAKSSTYNLSSVSTESAGSYSVAVSNCCGLAISEAANLAVDVGPSIIISPQSQAVCVGSDVTFSVQASGSEPISYQWMKDETEIPEANTVTYSITNASIDSAGRYGVIVSNNCGQVISDAAILEIGLKPDILFQPESQAVCGGSQVTLSVQAAGSEQLYYQWEKDGIEIQEANSSTYTIPCVGIDSQGSYTVTVSNRCGQATSEAAILEISMKPSILVQPVGQAVCEGSEVVFSVQAYGTGPLSYQWTKDGVDILEANSSNYIIPNADIDDAGSYRVMVRNPCGEVKSIAANLNIDIKPHIVTQPESQVVCEGSEVAFSVEATGSQPLSYQWKKDGIDIEGASSDYYFISPVTADDAGKYSVTVSNWCGQLESEAANLIVNSKPQILVQPVSQAACSGTRVTFIVQASGSEPISYQWVKDGSEIPGAITESYTIPCLEVSDAGAYYVIVSNSCGEVISDPAFLTAGLKPAIKSPPKVETKPVICCARPSEDSQSAIDSQPVIVAPPSSQTVCEGSIAKFGVECDGVKSLSYQWVRNGIAIPGANSNRYAIFNAAPEDEGRYSVIVSNCYASVESCAASLSVITPPIVIAQPDSQIAQAGTSASFTAKVRGTGPLSFQWKKNGMDIPAANSASYLIRCVNLNDAGCYRVTVSNGCCSSESNEVFLKVQDAVPGYYCSQ